MEKFPVYKNKAGFTCLTGPEPNSYVVRPIHTNVECFNTHSRNVFKWPVPPYASIFRECFFHFLRHRSWPPDTGPRPMVYFLKW